MPFSIKVSNLENKASWTKQLTEEEYKSVNPLLKGYEAIFIPCAALKPVRTNTAQNFAKDFFLPTVVNHAIKVQDTVWKIFAILGALILDLITLPIRWIRCIPTLLTHREQKEHLFKKYLIEQGVEAKLLASDHVRVRVEWEQMSVEPTSFYTTQKGAQNTKHSLEKHWKEHNVNFIEQPSYPGSDHLASGKI